MQANGSERRGAAQFRAQSRPGTIGVQGEERRDRINKAFRSYARHRAVPQKRRAIF